MVTSKFASSVFLIGMSAGIFAQVTPTVATPSGYYTYNPNSETRAFCKKYKKPLPAGELVLSDDLTFSCKIKDSTGVRETLGTYAIEGDLVRFSVEVGLGQDIPHVMRFNGRGLLGPGVAFSKQAGKVAPEEIPGVIGVANVVGINGDYYGNGDSKILLSFTGGKRFSYSGLGYKSSGEYTYDKETRTLKLIYRMIDGKKAEFDMSKSIQVQEDGTFTIERCVYRAKDQVVAKEQTGG